MKATGKKPFHSMCTRAVAALLLLGACLSAEPLAAQGIFGRGRNIQRVVRDVSAKEVRIAIEHGVQSLKGRQQADGRWSPFSSFKGGVSALATLAIYNATEDPNDEAVVKGVQHLTSLNLQQTYVVALRIMVLASVDPEGKKYLRLVQDDIDLLVRGQTQQGGWTYGAGRGGGRPDSSNSQFALLALHEASRMGAHVPDETWKMARKYWNDCGVQGGGYGYHPGRAKDATRTMTCAGISSAIIIDENYPDLDKLLDGQRVKCCSSEGESDQLEKSIKWMGSHFRIRGRAQGGGKPDRPFYLLYGLERAGRLSGRRFFGAHDWYREGVSYLISQQSTSGAWSNSGNVRGTSKDASSAIATSMALLFLSKGKRPVAIGKYLFNNSDDEFHRMGVHYLTRKLEDTWKQKLNWQEVHGESASVNDLLETPVLFMSGNGAIVMDDQQKANLKKYIENGGFVFAEACQGDGCGQAEFDRSFRQLMAELFPDNELEALPPNHPVWTARYKLDRPDQRPLLGLQACCKTSVIYCPTNLSCYWNIDRPGIERRMKKFAPRYDKLLDQTQYATKVGVNVVTYATGQELKDKGDTPKLEGRAKSVLVNRSLELPKLVHGGGWDEAPNAWRNIQKRFAETGISINPQKLKVEPDLEQLSNYPFVFMHGRSSFEFSEEEREALGQWLRMGGFIFADSICSSEEFTKSFRSEMQLILGAPLKPIDPDHAIWTDRKFLFPIKRVTLRKKRADGQFEAVEGPPRLEGAMIEDRLAIVFSENDLSCAMENAAVSQCEGYKREDAERIGVNVLLYRLRGD